jgi:hypothetical protein
MPQGRPEAAGRGGAGLIFKGSGFYITDYKNKGPTKPEGGESKPAPSQAGRRSKARREPGSRQLRGRRPPRRAPAKKDDFPTMSYKLRKKKGAELVRGGPRAPFLSVVLGIVLGAAYLVTKPVKKVTEIPKDAPAGAVYYIEGTRTSNKTPDVETKRRPSCRGSPSTVDEGELNILGGRSGQAAPPLRRPSPATSLRLPPLPRSTTRPLNVRIHDGKIQFADTSRSTRMASTRPLSSRRRGDLREERLDVRVRPRRVLRRLLPPAAAPVSSGSGS